MIINTSENDAIGAVRVEAIESAAKGDAPDAKGTAAPAATKPARGRKAKRTAAKAEPVSAPKPAPSDPATTAGAGPMPAVSKLDRLLALLRRPAGATIAELVLATGWRAHSVRGAMAGALRKKGHAVVSEKAEGGPRRYRVAEPS